MSSPSSRSRLADLALLLVAVTWGGSYLATQHLTDALPVTAVLALRFVPSLLVLGVVFALRRGRLSRLAWQVGLVLGAIQAVTLALEAGAVTHTSATNAGVLTCLAIVIAPAMEGVLTGERLPRAYFVATAVSVVGVAMLLGPHGFTRPNIGDLMVLVAATTRAVLVVASSRLSKRGPFDAVAVCFVQTLLNAVIYAALAAPVLSHVVWHLSVSQWVVVAFLSAGCTALAFLFQLWGIHHTSAARASLLMGTEPVWALLAGVVLGGESLGPLGAAGALVVIGATAWGGRIEAAWRRRVLLDVPTVEEDTLEGIPFEVGSVATFRHGE